VQPVVQIVESDAVGAGRCLSLQRTVTHLIGRIGTEMIPHPCLFVGIEHFAGAAVDDNGSSVGIVQDRMEYLALLRHIGISRNDDRIALHLAAQAGLRMHPVEAVPVAANAVIAVQIFPGRQKCACRCPQAFSVLRQNNIHRVIFSVPGIFFLGHSEKSRKLVRDEQRLERAA